MLPASPPQPGAVLDCTTPTGRGLSRQAGFAEIRTPPVYTAVNPLVPNQSEPVQLKLPAGRWQLSLPYLSEQAVNVTGAGLNVTLPPNLDRPGTVWPVGTVTSTGAPITLTFHMTDAGVISSHDPVHAVLHAAGACGGATGARPAHPAQSGVRQVRRLVPAHLLMLGDRPAGLIARAILEPSQYAAVARMVRRYPAFPDVLKRYLLGGGHYPYACRVRTPTGEVAPTTYTHHDIFTVQEVFGREDYRAARDLSVAVDIGSNIGISALYFLTRNRDARCYLYEPVPRNVERLHANLTATRTATRCATWRWRPTAARWRSPSSRSVATAGSASSERSTST